MAKVIVQIEINAPIERVFDLARSVDLHVCSAGATGEVAVGGITMGLMGADQEVTWRAKHFWIWQTLTSRITIYSRPDHFRDSMVRGAFKRFDHDHTFTAHGAVTRMTDVFDFDAPGGFFGKAAELFLIPYMRGFIAERSAVIKNVAESHGWKRFLRS